MKLKFLNEIKTIFEWKINQHKQRRNGRKKRTIVDMVGQTAENEHHLKVS